MGILDETRFVERLRFFDGQRLLASDLQGIEAFHREMRWLHNRSLHQPGIGNGFAVSGEHDDREIRIGPGYALDALGREIVLTHEQVEPIPPVAGEVDGQSVYFDLVVSYDESPETAETREGICLKRGIVRLREEPVLCFVRLERGEDENLTARDKRLGDEILSGLRIVLARLEVIDCRLKQQISLSQRRSARPARLPFIACGTADIPRNLFSQTDQPNILTLNMLVDTTSAGFAGTPCYSVRLDRQRFDSNEGVLSYYILDGSVQVRETDARSFVVEAVINVRDFRTSEDPGENLLDGWKVVWMGVE